MAERKIVRETPDLFSDGPCEMIGKPLNGNKWEKFIWGENNKAYIEYAPYSEKNKHLIGTDLEYYETLSENDVVVSTSKDEIKKVIDTIKNFSTNQMGACAMYSLMKYAQGINKTTFMLRDNSFTAMINIMSNKDVEKILKEATKE